jgi:peroxiredoxin
MMRAASLVLALTGLLFTWFPLLRGQSPDASGQATSTTVSKPTSDGPTDEKARRTYREGLDFLHLRRNQAALDSFKKADNQDGGRCFACQRQMIKYGLEFGDWKAAELGASEMVAEAKPGAGVAQAHEQFAEVLFFEGVRRRSDDCFARAHDEVIAALAAYPKFPDALFVDGKALANLRRDDEAKARFEQYVQMKTGDDPEIRRARRYIDRPELARARMAPPFAVTTVDGKRVSLDDFEGKVVLLDFWATWCGPCIRALPHMFDVARKFEGQPLVILSVSLDSDEKKWKEFVAKHKMTWLQYWDGGFEGAISKQFGVTAIPQTFTIDSDGVLKDQHIGDGAIEGELSKLVSHARKMQMEVSVN